MIILSTVRSNSEGKIGFVADHRRMNVAITRAKRGLVVVGDPETLSHNPLWKQWIRTLETKNLIVDSIQVPDCSNSQTKKKKMPTKQKQPATSTSKV